MIVDYTGTEMPTHIEGQLKEVETYNPNWDKSNKSAIVERNSKGDATKSKAYQVTNPGILAAIRDQSTISALGLNLNDPNDLAKKLPYYAHRIDSFRNEALHQSLHGIHGDGTPIRKGEDIETANKYNELMGFLDRNQNKTVRYSKELINTPHQHATIYLSPNMGDPDKNSAVLAPGTVTTYD
jgi:hypothetical protein